MIEWWLYYVRQQKETSIMNKTEDLRVKKTKAALHTAFFAMLSENSLEDITINDLCEKANIRRATFYKHFDDKLDFITYIIKDIRFSFDSEFTYGSDRPTLNEEYCIKYVESIIDFMLKREAAITKIINSSMRPVFIEIFMQQNYLDTLERLRNSIEDGLVLSTSPEVVSSMIVGGVSINILRWYENRHTISSSDMINELSRLIRAILR